MMSHSVDESDPAHDYVNASSMSALVGEFDDLATGRAQRPRRRVHSTIRNRIDDHAVLEHLDHMVKNSGPLFQHFLASVPGILEEMSRVGAALNRLARSRAPREKRVLTFYEGDAFDGTNARALVEAAQGSVVSLTSSPNKANEPWFYRFADPRLSQYFPESLFLLSSEELKSDHYFESFSEGFDFFYETAAFQFYGTDRKSQVGHVTDLLRSDGIAFFLEKFDHKDSTEYEVREDVKDRLHKSLYFSSEEIEWKREAMLARMSEGQVTLAEMSDALHTHFSHVHLLWNGGNFCEVVASNSKERLSEFLEVLGPPLIPDEFCRESVMRPLDQSRHT